MAWNLAGKAAIVTGASAGIGEALVRALVDERVKVGMAARREDRLQELVRELGGDRVIACPGDLTIREDRERLLRRTVDAFGPVQLLVNNAGFGQKGPLELVGEGLAKRQFDTNVFAPMELIRLVVPGMRVAGEGRIINVSSVVGRVAMPLQGWYSASKHALEALSDVLRVELGPFGIDVVLIEPGPIATEFFEIAERSLAGLEGDRAAYERTIAAESRRRRSPRLVRMAPDACARVIVRAARAPRPGARYPVTAITRLLCLLKWTLPTRLMDWFIARASGLPARAEGPDGKE